ncbi:bifunctional 5-dehydro-2-deoxygluconokinase/5-dehydro-2-deoxyphosphogluconate aldolase [Oceaniglobus trochenteri]|uniref:bifunctional 5-dehydro-2-deoxygluconokinase/5-dehydro-2- deoxyphosphogluconate aldolase n=1 Tax=Oceaniglobus trochenteri TaxID=2763260 RepID=UPI001CFF8C94|nr:5-dehydro-2-deoxygluconokinase [Oceaniglobus trochenteri]
MSDQLDIITIGRSCVDLYGSQIGGRLEDMRSFEKYVGGSPTNIACGAARLGLRTGVITAVGDEHMGRFITEELTRFGVDTAMVKVDPERITALAMLGIRDEHQFPLIFFRENCADMGLTEADIDPAQIARTRAVVATGTHLSLPSTEAAVLKALRLAGENGARRALDIDYRPNLWGLAGHGAGEQRYIASQAVTERLQAHLGLFDLIVGTEEEFHIAGGSTDTIAALRAVRAISNATLVCKRGPMGAVAFGGAIPDSLDDGETGPGFAIEVFNVLGAGDGFMAGLLKGWMDGEGWPRSLEYANACGAIAVSRHGCSPAYPSLTELDHFLTHGSATPALRKDPVLEQIHWATTRRTTWDDLRIFAFDHRIQLEEMEGATPERIAHVKALCLEATLAVAKGERGYGILCDNRLGRHTLHRAAGSGLWVGRPVEWPASRPLTCEPEIGADFGGLAEWPADQVCKVLCFYHPDDPETLRADQERTVQRLFHACRRNRLEFLLEVIPSKFGPVDDDTTARVIRRFYELGVYPDWWKLEPMQSDAAWKATCDAIEDNDPNCNGIVVLGLGQAMSDLLASFDVAAGYRLVRGFAVGRTIMAEVAAGVMDGSLDDAQAVENMTRRFQELCDGWDRARAAHAGKT